MSELSVAEVLNMAADKIAEPDAWTQYAFARDAKGYPTGTKSPAAVCFCIAGAIYAVSPTLGFGSDIIERLPKPRGYPNIARWNDASTRTQAQAVAKLRKLAARLSTPPRVGEG
jgi:hypothetical protein